MASFEKSVDFILGSITSTPTIVSRKQFVPLYITRPTSTAIKPAPISSSYNKSSINKETSLMEEIISRENGDLQYSDFKLQFKIGEGSFGKIYRALPKNTKIYGRELAAKIISKKTVLLQSLESHIVSQIMALKEIRSPYKIQFVGCLTSASQIIIVSELAKGCNLYQYMLQRGLIQVQECRKVSLQMLQLIRQCHKASYIYRDLKPQNIMYDSQDGRVKLVDFGLSKKVKPNQRTFTFCGTTEYMAPQMINQGGYGFSVDWWSFGVLLYEMAQGNVPFSNQNPIEVYKAILQYAKKDSYLRFKTSDNSLKAAIRGLLRGSLSERLGHNASRVEDHQFFKKS